MLPSKMMNGWNEVPTDPRVGGRAFQKFVDQEVHLTAFLNREPDSNGRRWQHLSVSCRTNSSKPKVVRAVTRDELYDARVSLVRGPLANVNGEEVEGGDLLMADIFPPVGQWQPGDQLRGVSHLWEIPRELWD